MNSSSGLKSGSCSSSSTKAAFSSSIYLHLCASFPLSFSVSSFSASLPFACCFSFHFLLSSFPFNFFSISCCFHSSSSNKAHSTTSCCSSISCNLAAFSVFSLSCHSFNCISHISFVSCLQLLIPS